MSRQTVSEHLKQVIQNSGMTYREISRNTGIGHTSISRFVSGERGINDEILSKLCDYFDLELRPREKASKKK